MAPPCAILVLQLPTPTLRSYVAGNLYQPNPPTSTAQDEVPPSDPAGHVRPPRGRQPRPKGETALCFPLPGDAVAVHDGRPLSLSTAKFLRRNQYTILRASWPRSLLLERNVPRSGQTGPRKGGRLASVLPPFVDESRWCSPLFAIFLADRR